MRQSGICPILCHLMAILGKLVDMDFKFVLPSSYINFDIQTNFEVNQTKRIWSPYFVPIDGQFEKIGRYGLQICFVRLTSKLVCISKLM